MPVVSSCRIEAGHDDPDDLAVGILQCLHSGRGEQVGALSGRRVDDHVVIPDPVQLLLSGLVAAPELREPVHRDPREVVVAEVDVRQDLVVAIIVDLDELVAGAGGGCIQRPAVLVEHVVRGRVHRGDRRRKELERLGVGRGVDAVEDALVLLRLEPLVVGRLAVHFRVRVVGRVVDRTAVQVELGLADHDERFGAPSRLGRSGGRWRLGRRGRTSRHYHERQDHQSEQWCQTSHVSPLQSLPSACGSSPRVVQRRAQWRIPRAARALVRPRSEAMARTGSPIAAHRRAVYAARRERE